MAIRFAFVFKSELATGLAFLHFNKRSVSDEYVVSCLQASHQQATEEKLMQLVRRQYPDAVIWEDKEHPARYRYIKTK